jgi:hypothetical protein
VKKTVKKIRLSKETIKNLALKPGDAAGAHTVGIVSCETCDLNGEVCQNNESTIDIFTRCFC